jgi:oligopeptide transport system substrate-binding protein
MSWQTMGKASSRSSNPILIVFLNSMSDRWQTIFLPLSFGQSMAIKSMLINNLLCSVLFICISLFSLESVAVGLDYENRSISLAITQEPPDLNTTTSTDGTSFMVLHHLMEGLLSYDQDQNLVGGVAERWELRSDGATFWLRKSAKWSDGSPVTAHDFVFAWRKVLDPANASEYAFVLFPVLNAQAINEGKLSPDALGVEAINDHQLEVKLFQPCPYFLGLTAFNVLHPVKASFYLSRGERYAADAGDMLYNGPFVLSEWVHGASLRMEKNDHYWNRKNIWLNRIDVPYITEDANARLNLFRDRKIALADNLVAESLDGALQQRMQIKTFLDGALFFIEFNHREDHVTRNRNLRKAIQSVFNSNDLVYKVLGNPGSYPTYTHFPRWAKGRENLFVREYPPHKLPMNIGKGREYLAAAKRELGVDKIPPITLLADDSPNGQKTSEFLQTLLKQTLDIDVRVDVQIFKQRLAKMTAGDFDMVVSGWGPDYDDLLTYGDLFLSHNLNNRGRYKSAEYDHWVGIAQRSLDTRERMQAFNEMQRLIYDDVAIVPLYERGKIFVQHPRLKNVVRRAVGGDPNFNFVRIEP